jgi:hypothetical protein
MMELMDWLMGTVEVPRVWVLFTAACSGAVVGFAVREFLRSRRELAGYRREIIFRQDRMNGKTEFYEDDSHDRTQ